MTTPEERRQEFFEQCLGDAENERPGVVRIDGQADQNAKRRDSRTRRSTIYKPHTTT